MYKRVIYDDRVTITRDMLATIPGVWDQLKGLAGGKTMEVKCFYRCNSFLWWLAEASESDAKEINKRLSSPASAIGEDTGGDASDNFVKEPGQEGAGVLTAQMESTSQAADLVNKGLLAPPIPQLARSTLGKDYRRKNKLSPNAFWFGAECGLVLPALSNWEVKVKEKGVRASTGFVCVRCSGTWRSGRGGGYMSQMQTDEAMAQVVLDSPPDREWNAWANSRMEFYRRLEPHGPLRDEAPAKMPSSMRVRLQGQASDLLWRLVLSNPEKLALQGISALARSHASSSSQC
jgi:hypothetical protein